LEQGIARNYEKYKTMNVVIVDSFTVADKLREYGFENEIVTIHIPFDPAVNEQLSNELRERLNSEKEFKDKHFLISVSGNGKNKNLPMIKAVMESLPQDWYLIRVGDRIGFESELQYSELSYSRLLELHSVADALIFPSTNKGYGVPQIETIGMGIPALAYDLKVSRELLGESALYATNREEFIENFKIMMENRQNYRKRALEGKGIYIRNLLQPTR
jgi:glycosyltransferase involved in cell wall biosynthesis